MSKDTKEKNEWHMNMTPFSPTTMRSKLILTIGYIFYKLGLITAKGLGNMKLTLWAIETSRGVN